MRHSILAAVLLALCITSVATAKERQARLSPETAGQLRALHAEAVQLRASGSMDQAARRALLEQANALLDGVPDDLRATVTERVQSIKGEIAARVPAEVREAAAAVKEDLRAIQSGGYVTRSDLRALGQAVAAAMSDRTFTEMEKAQLIAQARSIAAQVPSELRSKLEADVQALADLLASR